MSTSPEYEFTPEECDHKHSITVSDMSCSGCGKKLTMEEIQASGPQEPTRLTGEQAATFVEEFLGGQLFTDLHLSDPSELPMVFMNIGLSGPMMAPSFLEKTGLVWEHLHKAGPMSINGMPNFFSCNFMHVEDWNKIRPILQEKMDRQRAESERLAQEFGG